MQNRFCMDIVHSFSNGHVPRCTLSLLFCWHAGLGDALVSDTCTQGWGVGSQVAPSAPLQVGGRAAVRAEGAPVASKLVKVNTSASGASVECVVTTRPPAATACRACRALSLQGQAGHSCSSTMARVCLALLRHDSLTCAVCTGCML